MKTDNLKFFDTGYNPKIQITSNSFSTKYFYENSSVKDTTSEMLKNKSVPISNPINKFK